MVMSKQHLGSGMVHLDHQPSDVAELGEMIGCEGVAANVFWPIILPYLCKLTSGAVSIEEVCFPADEADLLTVGGQPLKRVRLQVDVAESGSSALDRFDSYVGFLPVNSFPLGSLELRRASAGEDGKNEERAHQLTAVGQELRNFLIGKDGDFSFGRHADLQHLGGISVAPSTLGERGPAEEGSEEAFVSLLLVVGHLFEARLQLRRSDLREQTELTGESILHHSNLLLGALGVFRPGVVEQDGSFIELEGADLLLVVLDVELYRVLNGDAWREFRKHAVVLLLPFPHLLQVVGPALSLDLGREELSGHSLIPELRGHGDCPWLGSSLFFSDFEFRLSRHFENLSGTLVTRITAEIQEETKVIPLSCCRQSAAYRINTEKYRNMTTQKNRPEERLEWRPVRDSKPTDTPRTRLNAGGDRPLNTPQAPPSARSSDTEVTPGARPKFRSLPINGRVTIDRLGVARKVQEANEDNETFKLAAMAAGTNPTEGGSHEVVSKSVDCISSLGGASSNRGVALLQLLIGLVVVGQLITCIALYVNLHFREELEDRVFYLEREVLTLIGKEGNK